MVHEYERIRHKIPELLQTLLVRHCAAVDDAIAPGLTVVSWVSMNLKDYLDNVTQALHKLELIIDRVTSVVHDRINITLEQIINLPLCELPVADAITTEMFMTETKQLCEAAGDKLDSWNVMVEKASHELVTLLLPDDEILLDESIQSKQPRPGTAAYKHNLDERTRLQQEAKELVNYFNRQTIDALVAMTRRSLELLRKRIATASHTYGDYSDDKKSVVRHPLFTSNVLLSLPNVVMRPSLDDIQQTVNQAVQVMVGVTKKVYLWGQDRSPPKETNLRSRSDIGRCVYVCVCARVCVAGSLYIHGDIPLRVLRSTSTLLKCNQKTLNSYHRIISEHKEVLKISSILSSSINSTKRMVTMAMEQFHKHKQLWMEERETIISEYVSEERSVGDFQESMQRYVKLSELINNDCDVITVGPLSLHCGEWVM